MIDETKRIPSLDGLRAASILMVLVGHSLLRMHPVGTLQRVIFSAGNYGATGVSVFFAISGFLITMLWKRERQTFGGISRSDFYVRRTFRILPAFAVYVGAVGLLAGLHVISVDRSDFLHALTFTTDFDTHTHWFLGHTWSLSVEEQFYLVWPIVVVSCSDKMLTRIALAVILLEPFLRVGTYFLMPGLRGQVIYMAQTRADALMFGCLIALLYDSAKFQQWTSALVQRRWPCWAALLLLPILPWLERPLRGPYIFCVEYSLQGVCISVILLYAILLHNSRVGRLLNSKVVVHVGVLSYSLYLWQELFLGGTSASPSMLLARLALAFGFAELSYFAVERPMLRLGKRFRRERVVGTRARALPVVRPDPVES